MLRLPAYLLLVFGLISVTLVLYGSANAQDATEDLVPIANDVPLTAFRPAPRLAGADPNVVVQEIPPRAAPAQFTDMLVRWQVTEPASSTLELEVRVSSDGATWTNWVMVDEDPGGAPSDDLSVRWSTPFYVDLVRFYQFRIVLEPGVNGALPTLTSLQAHTLYVEDQPLQASPVTSAVTPGLDLAAAVPMPSYVSRTAWGNPDGESAPNAPPRFRTATHLLVHHTADANTLSSREPNWASRVRAIWAYHANTQGWGDIGYNFLIDPNGVIYQGRAGSNDPTRDAVGFHDAANYGSMGVAFLGTYTSAAPTSTAQTSMVNIMAWKAAQRSIDVQGKSFYYGCSISRYCSPYNSGSIVPNLAGHRDVMPGQTACPGDALFSGLPQIRQRVVDKLKQAPQRTDNGDLTIDNTESTFTWAGELFGATCGVGNQTNWSYASNETDGITNDVAGLWRPTIPTSGQYKVLVHIPSCSTVTNLTTSARYEIGHGSGKSNVTINQQTQRGWVELGTFNFAAGTSGYVRLTDLTSENFSDKRAIMFDAVQWVPVTPQLTPSPTPSPTPRTDNGDLTIDNTESTFTWAGELFGATCGFGNHTNWSYASNETDGITNDGAAVWRPNIPKTGQYKVLAHIPSCSSPASLTTNARYEITHGGGKATVTINQSMQRGWVELGTFGFNAGTAGSTRLTDLTSESFSDKRAILFDAVQWVPVTTPTMNNPLECDINGAVRTNGSIDVTIGCPDARATQFEIQARDTGSGVVTTLTTMQRELTFFGTPGRTYELRMRASDGTTWGALSSEAESTVRVPANASFTRIMVPRASR